MSVIQSLDNALPSHILEMKSAPVRIELKLIPMEQSARMVSYVSTELLITGSV